MKITQIISEKYVNAIGIDPKAIAIKQKYKDQVWDLLQQSYKKIGGIKGKGFETPNDMLKLPMWKIGVRNGTAHAVIMYKDKNGRKSVAVGSDGSKEATSFINDIFKNELQRAYGEKSKAALGKMMKLLPWEVIQPFLVDPDRVAIMQPQARVIALADVKQDDWPSDAQLTISKYTNLLPYGYLRDLNGTLTFKIMMGSPGRSIK